MAGHYPDACQRIRKGTTVSANAIGRRPHGPITENA